MTISKFNSFRRYTPPTCTLEIYHPQPFWGRWQDQSFPPLFSFQLHFDDPRLAQDDRISIIGDRNLLEQLRIKIQAYINKYLKQTTITSERLACDLPTKAITNQEDTVEHIIHLSRQENYSHLLYYQSFVPHAETIEVVLNNTQLLDLVNALEAYHWDANQVKVIQPKKNFSPRLAILITALTLTVGGLIWWRYQENENLVTTDNNSSNTGQKSSNNFQAVIPPSPLDTNSIPQIIVPKIPPELSDQKSLVPPPIAAKTPNLNIPNSTPSNIISNNYSATTSNSGDIGSAIFDIIPKNPNPVNKEQQQAISPKKTEKISLEPLKSLPTLSPANSQLNQSSNLSTNNIAMSSSLLPGNLSTTNIDNQNSQKSNLKLETNFLASNSPQKISQNISAEVKKYFQGKWKAPENLKQSIEYRLELEDDGTLTKVTPVGQMARLFLAQTPIPVINQTITSPFTEIPSLTVRLILSPNGEVQTFAEYRNIN